MPGRNIYLRTTPLADALRLWQEKLASMGLRGPLGNETIAVADSAGRITACPIHARISSPAYHCCAMDGYAVRFAMTLGATEKSPLLLAIGTEAREVDTGDPLPEGFDAVVMVEDVNITGGHIEIIAPATPWQHVRTVGEDIVATELVAPENHRIRPIDMGAMLAGGLTAVSVRRRPKVVIIPTGDELVEAGAEVNRGDIIDFNSHVLRAMCREWGADASAMPIVRDNRDALRHALAKAAAEADLVVVNAGASAGREDLTAHIIAELGELHLHGVGIKPGKPLMLGAVGGRPVIGTPGYPVAAYTVLRLFAHPLLMRMQGIEPPAPMLLKARLSRQVASSIGSEEFLRVKVGHVDNKYIATPLGRGAGLVSSLQRADGFLRIPADSEGLGSGADVDIELTRAMDEIESTCVCIGSHDMAMELLGSFLKRNHPRMFLSSAHVGSMGGLAALKKGEAHMAPCHLLDEETGQYNVSYIQSMLAGGGITLVNLVQRTQGLMVPPGNPKGIIGFADLARQDVTFVNRQRGAGTRLLLDKALRDLGIGPDNVLGYGRELFTHMAIASAVLSGEADTGLGVLSAARALGLDFIPVAGERYDLAIPTRFLTEPVVAATLDTIRTDAGFREAVLAMGGYDVSLMGQVMYEQQGS